MTTIQLPKGSLYSFSVPPDGEVTVTVRGAGVEHGMNFADGRDGLIRRDGRHTFTAPSTLRAVKGDTEVELTYPELGQPGPFDASADEDHAAEVAPDA